MKQTTYDEKPSTAGRSRGERSTPSGSGRASGYGGNEVEMKERMEAAGQPGPAHQALDALTGNWTAEVKCWKEPGQAPEVSQATAEASWILDGRFLQEEFHGEMMGQSFEGLTLLGFDNTKQTFNSVWISDMQTSMFVSEGKGDSGYKVITLQGKASCAATGQTDVPMKTVLRLHSDDKRTFEMYDGKNAKVMEITYTRE